MVAAAHGLDSSQYTFHYVAGRALQAVDDQNDLADILRTTGQRVIGAASLILEATRPESSITDAALDALETDVRIQTQPARWEHVATGQPSGSEPSATLSPPIPPTLSR